jgi:glycosyltransferase involved in cell wall biosynthesis
MSKDQLISIVITNFNYSFFLRRCIISLVKQNLKNIEILIIDDGSTDNSKGEIELLKNQYGDFFYEFNTIFLKQNGGKLHALNIGLAMVKGDITIILDADDYLVPHYIKTTVNKLISGHSQNEQVAFVYTDCYLVDENDQIIGQGKSTPFDIDLLICESYIPECAPTLTKVLKESLPFDETIRIGTKHHKWLKIVRNDWVGLYLPLPLFFYRMHENNLSGIGNKILSELNENSSSAKLLSGYWPSAT